MILCFFVVAIASSAQRSAAQNVAAGPAAVVGRKSWAVGRTCRRVHKVIPCGLAPASAPGVPEGTPGGVKQLSGGKSLGFSLMF